jgi:hypothetical protein
MSTTSGLLRSTSRNYSWIQKKSVCISDNIETVKKAEQPSGLAFAGTHRTKTRKFSVDTMSKWISCSTRKQKSLPSKTTSKHSSDTEKSSDDKSEVDVGHKRKTQGRSQSLKETNKANSHSQKANPKIRKATV